MAARVKQPAGPPTWTSPEYIAQCEAQARHVRIGYAGTHARAVAVLVRQFRRIDPDIRPIVSLPMITCAIAQLGLR